jgi:hypothetical protein
LTYDDGHFLHRYLVAECWLGPTVAELQAAAPPAAQGLTTGVFSGLTLVGNLAPALLGFAVSSLGYELTPSLAASVSTLYAASAMVFVAAAESARVRPRRDTDSNE